MTIQFQDRLGPTSQKLCLSHRFYVWRETLSGIDSVLAQELSGIDSVLAQELSGIDSVLAQELSGIESTLP